MKDGLRQDIWKNDSTRHWIQCPPKLYLTRIGCCTKEKEKMLKDTKRDKKRVRESDEWTSKNLNCTDYSINNVMKRDDSLGVKRDDSCWWWWFCNLSKQRLRGVVTLVNWRQRLNQWRRSFISNKILSIRLDIKKKYHRWMLIFFSYKKKMTSAG